MGITHIMRGTEYLSSTPKYNLLYDAFGWEKPTYIHLPPVMADSHRKLSKRKGDPSFEDLLDMGYLKDAIVNYVALLGWNPGTDQERFTLEELVKAFALQGLSKSPAIFDMAKLTWFNAEYIRSLDLDVFHELVRPYFARAIDVDRFDTRRLAELMQPRCEVLPDVVDTVSYTHLDVYKRQKLNRANWKNMVTDILKKFKEDGFDRVNPSIVKAAVQGVYPDFDERSLGFSRFSDVMRELEKAGVLRVEFDEAHSMLLKIL